MRLPVLVLLIGLAGAAAARAHSEIPWWARPAGRQFHGWVEVEWPRPLPPATPHAAGWALGHRDAHALGFRPPPIRRRRTGGGSAPAPKASPSPGAAPAPAASAAPDAPPIPPVDQGAAGAAPEASPSPDAPPSPAASTAP